MSAARPDRTPALLLFDIDGTLLAGATGAHRRALHGALHAVHGIDLATIAEPPCPAGRTDGEIARLVLRSCGLSEAEIDAGAAAVRQECCRLYTDGAAEDLRGAVLPGVREVLERLAEREEARLALLTGNFEAVARHKLAAAGIGRFFEEDQGAFGSDSEVRGELPALARRRAAPDGGEHPRERTVLIGDTPRDIACARADDLRCVGVTTGRFGAAEMAEADWVAEDMHAAGGLLEALLDPGFSPAGAETGPASSDPTRGRA